MTKTKRVVSKTTKPANSAETTITNSDKIVEPLITIIRNLSQDRGQSTAKTNRCAYNYWLKYLGHVQLTVTEESHATENLF